MKIGIIGLGYVGLTLAEVLARQFYVIGYDIDPDRVWELNQGSDCNKEITQQQLQNIIEIKDGKGLLITNDKDDLSDADVYIVTIPTPVDTHNVPDINMLKHACETVGSVLQKNNVVIFESTVYPGLTEEECVPILAQVSQLKYNEDFYVGYSPERVNPGDTSRPIHTIKKIISGSHPKALEAQEAVYGKVITAGLYKVSSIKVAEAAKVIENTQRDINIAFVNELVKIFNLLEIDTHEVIAAASTKWNFMPYYPGLVGGHCIGVDPYYLSYKAIQKGFNPEIMLAGRRLNDDMHIYVASSIIKQAVKHNLHLKQSKVLVLGCTFKADCPDVRNSRVFHLIDELASYGLEVSVFDPVAEVRSVSEKYRQLMVSDIDNHYQIGILAVAHKVFIPRLKDSKSWLMPEGFTYGIQRFEEVGCDYKL